jgi:cytosine/adenosine deaminase-related metal-dependent hydrolase
VFVAAIAAAGPGFTAAAADFGALSALRAGTTTVWDSGPTGAGAEAMRRVGLTGISCVEAFGTGGPETVDAVLARLRGSLGALAPGDADGAVMIGIAPHAPYTVGPPAWAAIRDAVDLAGLPWTTHFAESPAEVVAITTGGGTIAEALAGRNVAPAQWPDAVGGGIVTRVAEHGGLRPGMVAAHCVQLVPGEPELLAAADVAVAHCPVSNANLGCGPAPLAALWDAGVRVGLGTDSPASAGAYDVRAEARACRFVHSAQGITLRPQDLVRLMTLGGAEAMGRADDIGSIAPGKRADLVAVRLPAHLAGADAHVVLLDERAEVTDVWVAGIRRVVDGTVPGIDVDGIAARAAAARTGVC